MRRLALLLLSPLLVSAADPVAEAQRAAAAAAREQQRQQQAAAQAKTEAERMRAVQEAAAATVIASETRIEALEAESRLLQARLAEREARLAAERRPAALLLGGLVHMGRRPPLLALADANSAEQFVRVRALVASTVPVIEARTAALQGELREVRRLAGAAQGKQAELARETAGLKQARLRFAELERQALARSASLGSQALVAGDFALGAAEQASRLTTDAQRRAAANRLALRLSQLPEALPRPAAPEEQPGAAPLAWHLPVEGRVTTGLFEVSDNGVRSRGMTIAVPRGARVRAPAAGKIAFAGPFRRRDGVVIIDHGGGWMTLMTEVRTTLPPGTPVQAGDEIGRSLGAVTVELTRNGTPQPAALIARPSPLLSKGGKSG